MRAKAFYQISDFIILITRWHPKRYYQCGNIFLIPCIYLLLMVTMVMTMIDDEIDDRDDENWW